MAEVIGNLLKDNDAALMSVFSQDALIIVIKIVIILVVGAFLVLTATAILKLALRKRLNSRWSNLIIKVTQYAGFILILINVLYAAKINLSALFGAAGIAGIAIGFASQTFISNVISRFFLISERVLSQGDIITVDGTTGIVHSSDSVSVKLRSFNNQLIRIPNEMLIKSKMTNISKFPARRYEFDVVVPYSVDIDHVRKVIFDIIKCNMEALRKPDPIILVKEFKEHGIALFVGLWFAKEDWGMGINSIHSDVQKRFREEGIQFAPQTMAIIN
jgi:small-conductance mechanosensitive channel